MKVAFGVQHRPESPQAFEYLVEDCSVSAEAVRHTISRLAPDGWRLAHVLRNGGNAILVFERPVAPGLG